MRFNNPFSSGRVKLPTLNPILVTTINIKYFSKENILFELFNKLNIFISMSSSRIKKYQNRRIMTDSGWKYFCNQCGDYKPESDFYNSKDTPFGITYKCREHFRYEEKSDKDTEHLKLNPITDSDLDQTKEVLTRLGYEFGPGKPPVWEQFNKKHNIK